MSFWRVREAGSGARKMTLQNNTVRKLMTAATALVLTSIAAWPGELVAATAKVGSSTAVAPGTDASVRAESASGQHWLVIGADFGQTHFSALKHLTPQNVSQLGLAWSLDVDSAMGLAVEPIEVDGTIFLSTSGDRVLAIDADSGRVRWTFDPHVPLSNMNHSYYARTNKGVAVWDGRVYVGTGDCRVIALNAATGQQDWAATICPDPSLSGIGAAPRVGGGRVYMGYGGDTGARGSVVALDAKSGQMLWRAWNMPGDPSKGFETPMVARAAATWRGKDWWQEGGAGVWEPITYDPQTNLVIYGTQGENPGGEGGDRLFTNCIVAVHADTGELAWYVPTWKYMPSGYFGPENFHVLVTDLTLAGRRRHVAMTVPRFGGLFVLDAATGEILSEKSLAERPSDQLSPPTPTGEPRIRTNHNWWPMSFNPLSGLLYVPVYDDVAKRQPGNEVTAVGRLVAWDPVQQSARWSVMHPLILNGGVLSTAGGLVFQGEGTGVFTAYAADTGRVLWSIKTGSAIQSNPVTYMLHGEQYVLLPVGFGSASRLFNANSILATPESKRGPSRLYAFKLGGKAPFPYPNVVVPPVPKPPAQAADAAEIRHGEEMAIKYNCWNCHGGPRLDGSGAWALNGAVPDLRYMPEDVHSQFLAIVLGGSHRENGMPGFGVGQSNPPVAAPSTPMTLEEANAIHAYIIDLEWQAYRGESSSQRVPSPVNRAR